MPLAIGEPNINDTNPCYDETSYHYQALDWMATDDNYTLGSLDAIRNGGDTSAEEDPSPVELLLERFVLVLFYFSTSQGGESPWESSLGFLNGTTSVCQWPPITNVDGEDEDSTDGVRCDASTDRVNYIRLGKSWS